jgi:hypothetical protein
LIYIIGVALLTSVPGELMGQAISDILPMAVGVAISPVPIIAIVLMLGTPRARVNGATFAVGWLVGSRSPAA